MTARETRKKAREALAGKWGKGALIALVYAIFSIILNAISKNMEKDSAVSLFINLAIIVINVPISFGLIISFMKLKRGEDVSAVDFFKDGFSNFGRAWGIIGSTILKMIVPIILIIIAVIIMGVAVGTSFVGIVASDSAKSVSQFGLVGFIGFVVYMAAVIYATVRAMLYSLSNFIAYDNPEKSTKDAVEESAKLMNGYRWKLFCLELSFIGWAFLAGLTMGIGMLWLIPYMQVALVCFYEQLAGKEDSSVEVISSDN